MNGIKKENALAEGKLRQTTYQRTALALQGISLGSHLSILFISAQHVSHWFLLVRLIFL